MTYHSVPVPPKGRPYKYSRQKVRNEVPKQAGVYWLRSYGDIVRIGQSENLRRRLLDYSSKQPNKFHYQTVSEYFRRHNGITRPPTTSVNRLVNKMEHTEFEWHKRKYGGLPPWNKQTKHYNVGVFEELLERIL